MGNSIKGRFEKSGKKYILSLDGGGLRGIFTLGLLKKLEDLLKIEKSNEDLVLSDHYDLIAGTSTGALIATYLSMGKKVDDIIKLYEELGTKIFDESRVWPWLGKDSKIRFAFDENYSSDNLKEILQNELGEETLGSESLKTGLVINAKRVDTYSLWSVTNHPNGKYYKANKDYKLWELCRATSAAPTYFKPIELPIFNKDGEEVSRSAFIDGGVSLANNPAWLAFLVTQEPSFGYCLSNGEENIHITSLGTGNAVLKEDPSKIMQMKGFHWAGKLLDLFHNDASETNQLNLSIFGKNIGPKHIIDRQFANPDELNFIGTDKKLFTFERHNVKLNSETFTKYGIQVPEKIIGNISQMDLAVNMPYLKKLGIQYANDIITKIYI